MLFSWKLQHSECESSIIIDLYLYDEYGYLCELNFCFFICNTNFPSYKKILIPHDESEMSDIALN